MSQNKNIYSSDTFGLQASSQHLKRQSIGWYGMSNDITVMPFSNKIILQYFRNNCGTQFL